MANVQIDNGDFTRIANEILEHVAKAKLNGTQYSIVITIWRYTYGFQRTSHDLSLGFLSGLTGIHKKQVGRELTKLVERKIVVIEQEATFKQPQILKFNKNYDEWVSTKKLTGSELIEGTGSELVDTPVSELVDHIKKEKESIKEKNPPVSPQQKSQPKKKYGEFKHVRLTDDEYSRLCGEYGQFEAEQAIKFLDEYIEEKGYKSKSHNLAIRRWVFDAVKRHSNDSRAGPSVVPQSWNAINNVIQRRKETG